jgi:hypothetical protein
MQEGVLAAVILDVLLDVLHEPVLLDAEERDVDE